MQIIQEKHSHPIPNKLQR